MGTGWRRVFCTAAPRDSIDTDPRESHHHHHQDQQKQGEDEKSQNQSSSPTPISCIKRGFFSSNPATPRTPALPASGQGLSCRVTVEAVGQPPASTNTASPRSPFSIFRNTLRPSRSGCGVCLQSVRTGQGTALYTAECSHAFHFPCIAAHVRKQGSLICPVCNVTWKDVPLLSGHTNLSSWPLGKEDNDAIEKAVVAIGAKTVGIDDKKFQSSISTIKTKGVISSKLYNDDEPLVSPLASTRFNPIAEEDEDDMEEGLSEDVEEFQGFCVNPTPSTKEKIGNGHDRKTPRNVEVKLLPEAAIISIDRTHETFVVALKVKAPPQPTRLGEGATVPVILSPSHRAPIDLVTVLDISGSMDGPKQQILKRAMSLVISSLGSADRLSIVAFSATSRRLLPLRRMTDHGQQSARRVIERVVCSQGKKCAAEALKKASKVLEDRREKNPVASIILLSDTVGEKVKAPGGGSNHQPRLHFHDSSIRFAHIELPVRSPEPMENNFARRIGGILSVVVQDLRIQLGFADPAGSAPVEITAVYSSKGRPTMLSCNSARLGNLNAEEERELLIEIKVPASAIGPHHVMTVRCSYMDPASQELMYCRERSLLVPRPHTVRSTDPRIERLRRAYMTTRALAESQRLVEHRDFAGAQKLVATTHAVLIHREPSIRDEFTRRIEAAQVELQWRQERHETEPLPMQLERPKMSEKEMAMCEDEKEEQLSPISAWRAAERLAKVAMMKKSLNKVSDLHGFENAGF
ncbi:E3 ubiquitin-protein ligase WAV3-like protein [Drosera capensis]